MREWLNSEDREVFQIFVNQANRLASCKFFVQGKPNIGLAWGDSITRAIVPERQEFIAMLTILRPFTMRGDAIFINKVVNRLRNCIERMPEKDNFQRSHQGLSADGSTEETEFQSLSSTPHTSSDSDEMNLKYLNLIHDKFKLYNGAYDEKSSKYGKKYSSEIHPIRDVSFSLEERTIHKILDLVINGYYFHYDLEKQKEIIEFVEQQKRKRLGSVDEESLTEESRRILNERIRESFKHKLYSLIIDLAERVFDLKNLIEEIFDFPLDERIHEQAQILHDLLDS